MVRRKGECCHYFQGAKIDPGDLTFCFQVNVIEAFAITRAELGLAYAVYRSFHLVGFSIYYHDAVAFGIMYHDVMHERIVRDRVNAAAGGGYLLQDLICL